MVPNKLPHPPSPALPQALLQPLGFLVSNLLRIHRRRGIALPLRRSRPGSLDADGHTLATGRVHPRGALDLRFGVRPGGGAATVSDFVPARARVASSAGVELCATGYMDPDCKLTGLGVARR